MCSGRHPTDDRLCQGHLHLTDRSPDSFHLRSLDKASGALGLATVFKKQHLDPAAALLRKAGVLVPAKLLGTAGLARMRRAK